MVCEICKDIFFLSLPSKEAVKEDADIGRDLLDTLDAHRDGCVGMAANMIGKSKRIIVFDDNGKPTLMYNPEIIRTAGRYEAEEGCLSLEGTRKCTRWKEIKVRYQNEKFETRIKNYTGWTAQIIQHEVDHLSGIII